MDLIIPDWPASAHIKACTTLRSTWGNVHTKSTDSAARQELKNLLQLPSDPVWIMQTHGTRAIEAVPENTDQEADASWSSLTNQICIVLTADCLPVLICNQAGTRIAAIHAGWRGLASGVIENTLKALGEPGESLLAWFGPAIGPNHFEVGKDVYDAFISQHAESAIAFIPLKDDKWLADLYQLARIRLNSQGVTQIYGGNFCTYSQPELFFSYRRDKGQTGRLASLIWIEKSNT